MIYVFDETFDGFLTAVFQSAQSKEPLDSVTDAFGQSIFLAVTQVITDVFQAGRVRQFIDTHLGADMMETVRYAFLSANPDRFTYTARTLHLARRHGARVVDVMDDAVLGFRDCYREAMRETHRFTGLTRFSELADGTLYAVIAPKHNVLPPVLAHFAQRYPRERLAVYDENRHLLGMLDAGRVTLHKVTMENPVPTQDEQAYRQLWRAFFESVTISERLNPHLQRQHMPKYTWRNLVEMQQTPAEKSPETQAFALQESPGRDIIWL